MDRPRVLVEGIFERVEFVEDACSGFGLSVVVRRVSDESQPHDRAGVGATAGVISLLRALAPHLASVARRC
jgi:hypothetical protein